MEAGCASSPARCSHAEAQVTVPGVLRSGGSWGPRRIPVTRHKPANPNFSNAPRPSVTIGNGRHRPTVAWQEKVGLPGLEAEVRAEISQLRSTLRSRDTKGQ